MAVNNNPFREWENLKESSDYRSTDTQITSLVRQQLSQPEYLLSSNRVNPGPLRNTRARVADTKPQFPHVTGSEDMWGWQPLTNSFDPSRLDPEIAENLKEQYVEQEIPGKSYGPVNEIGGASV